MKLPDNKYTLPDDLKEFTQNALDEYAQRLEYDAAAFAAVHMQEGALRSAELLRQAEQLRKASEYFLNL